MTSEIVFEHFSTFLMMTQGSSTENKDWRVLTMLISLVLKSFIKKITKRHSETVTVLNYRNADCSLRKKNYRVIYYNFRHTFVPCYDGVDVWCGGQVPDHDVNVRRPSRIHTPGR